MSSANNSSVPSGLQFTMSSSNNSSVPSGRQFTMSRRSVSNGQKRATRRRAFSKPNKNDLSVNVGSSVLSSVSNSIKSSPQYSYSNHVLPNYLALNHNSYPSSSTGVFHSFIPSSSWGLPNGGQKPIYNDRISNVNLSDGDNHNQVRYGYQDHYHEQWLSSYQGPSGCMVPCMSFPREQPQPYMKTIITPPMYPMHISNLVPSNWHSTYEVPNVNHYYPCDAYNKSICPQYNYFYESSYYVPSQVFYASLQSIFSLLVVDLRAKLRKQIEYYFSLENLPTDYYLKKHMDEKGWVPITLIAKFRRVQQLMNERQFIYESFGNWSFMKVKVKPLANITKFILDSLKPSYDVEVRGYKVRKRREWEKWVPRT